MKAKYCQRSNPVSKKCDTGDSLTLKYMLMNRHHVDSTSIGNFKLEIVLFGRIIGLAVGHWLITPPIATDLTTQQLLNSGNRGSEVGVN